MQKIVLDASVFVKLFLQEEGHHEVKFFMKKITAENIDIIVPEIFVYEVCSVTQHSGFDTAKAYNLITSYQKVNLKVIAINEKLVLQTIKLIRKNSNPKSGFPSFYDSSYHALAIINECKFITADKKHYDKTKDEGFIELFES